MDSQETVSAVIIIIVIAVIKMIQYKGGHMRGKRKCEHQGDEREGELG